MDWKNESYTSETERTSGSWHLRIKDGDDMYLSNYELLVSPSGIGKNEVECWRNFIEHCNRYLPIIKQKRDEAIQILQKLEND